MIKEQTLRMDTSIHDLVELKNITNKTVNPEPMDIMALINKVVSNHTTSKARIHLSQKGELSLKSDEYFIQIALNRILNNALSYHRTDSKTPMVEVNVESEIDGVTLVVKDNGLGITSKALPRVFEMFYKGTGSSTGHGLGLYIAKNALLRVKAKIDLSSVEGLGTEVKVFIPRIDGNAYHD
tara:strand:- start:651 stop:1196 length:546 start_codon:yes stop_codon:yes gene_type:complete